MRLTGDGSARSSLYPRLAVEEQGRKVIWGERCTTDRDRVDHTTDHRRPLRPPRDVLVEHDDGRWHVGSQFEWVRWPTGEWRAGVTYSTEPGSKFVRSVPAERTRLPAT